MLAKAEANKEVRAILMMVTKWWKDLANAGPRAVDVDKRQQSESTDQ
jgi:hypothetical protein